MATGASTSSGAAPLLNVNTRLTAVPGSSGPDRPVTCSDWASSARNVDDPYAASVIRAGWPAPAGAEAPALGAGATEVLGSAATEALVVGWPPSLLVAG